MNQPHYPRDKGMQAAEQYLGLIDGRIPMVRLPRKLKKRTARPSTNRLLAIWWMLCTAIKP